MHLHRVLLIVLDSTWQEVKWCFDACQAAEHEHLGVVQNMVVNLERLLIIVITCNQVFFIIYRYFFIPHMQNSCSSCDMKHYCHKCFSELRDNSEFHIQVFDS